MKGRLVYYVTEYLVTAVLLILLGIAVVMIAVGHSKQNVDLICIGYIANSLVIGMLICDYLRSVSGHLYYSEKYKRATFTLGVSDLRRWCIRMSNKKFKGAIKTVLYLPDEKHNTCYVALEYEMKDDFQWEEYCEEECKFSGYLTKKYPHHTFLFMEYETAVVDNKYKSFI